MNDPMPLPHRARAWWLGVVVPVIITSAGWALALSRVPDLPERVPLHWGPEGVDRVGTVGELLGPLAVMGGASLLLLAVLAVRTGRSSLTRRMVLALACGSAVFFTGMLLVQVLTAEGATDPTAVPSPDLGMTAVVVLAVAVGAAAGALAGADPALPATGELPDGLPRTDLAAGERAVWVRTVTAAPRLRRWGTVFLAVYVGFSLWFAVVVSSWFVGVLMLAVVPLMLTMVVWDVRVDATGLTARGSFGWPRQHVPASEVVSAGVRDVSPFTEFGGWGLRTSVHGTVGVVVRAGEAIAVERTGGRRFVVTVDDAATGAALLNTFAGRTRAEAR